MALKHESLVIVDIETTGGSFDYHRITEIGAIKVVDGKEVASFHSLIDPERSIPPSITQLTGITDDMVRGAPVFGGVAEELFAFLEGSVFTAHNARFDYGFIRHEFERVGKKFSSRVLCSARLSRALYPQFKRHNLSVIIERNNIKIDARHRALDDAKAVWEFFKIVSESIPEELQNLAIREIIKKPSLPVNLKTNVEDIPESAGVYFFYDENNTPLYIGKAKNLRSRVLSHFTETLSSNKEMNLAQQVTHIECVQTEGELAALLLESYHIKKHLPLYNRLSRRAWQLTALKVDTTGEYHKMFLEAYDSIHKENLEDIVTIFRTKGDAVKFLEAMAKEHHLCKTLLGIEKNHSRTGCFYFEIKQCYGACLKKEKSQVYNLRLQTVLAKHREIRWPFAGPIMIEEANAKKEKGEVIVLDHWIIQEAFRYNNDGQTPLFELDYTFDLDAFRILFGYMKRHKNLNLKVLPKTLVVEF